MKTILITGGTGFLGRTLGMQLRKGYHVILAGRNAEQNAYAKETTGCEVIPLDITNYAALREATAIYKPEIIVHAAATKYVNLSEKFPTECIDINIMGSQNVARVAMESKTAIVIGISTDKATPPCTTIYGISKSAMEKLFILLNKKSKTQFTCVRFGNIAWSTGSVFPIWKRMLEKDKLIQTTGYDMRRFMFSVQDAARMVRHSLENIETTNGNILAAKMYAAHMKDVLKVFTSEYGGVFEKIPAREGEKVDEIMVGTTEVDHTESVSLNGEEYYLIDYRKISKKPLANSVCTATSKKLSDNEIMELILHQ